MSILPIFENFLIVGRKSIKPKLQGFSNHQIVSIDLGPKKSEKMGRLDELLRRQDKERASYFEEPLRGDETGPEIRTKFYRMTSQPLQAS